MTRKLPALALPATALLLFAACAPPPPPQSTLAPLTGRAEPAPMPSEAADDYAAMQRARGGTANIGPAAMPGMVTQPPVGSDMTFAPLPAQTSPAFTR